MIRHSSLLTWQHALLGNLVVSGVSCELVLLGRSHLLLSEYAPALSLLLFSTLTLSTILLSFLFCLQW